ARGSEGHRVLLVEDDLIDRELAKRQLEMSDMVASVACAEHGQQALDQIDQDLRDGRGAPDWVVLDLNMPIMGGKRFLESALQIMPPEVAPQVLVLSGSTSDPGRLEVLVHPWVVDYIVKPLLLRDVRRVLMTPRSDPAHGRLRR
ncbi:MAG: response regulator, partial [Planctomycetota bacterium]